VIVVVPTGYGAFNGWPSLRAPVTTGLAQPPVATGTTGLMVAVLCPESVNFEIPPGQIIVKGALLAQFNVSMVVKLTGLRLPKVKAP